MEKTIQTQATELPETTSSLQSEKTVQKDRESSSYENSAESILEDIAIPGIPGGKWTSLGIYTAGAGVLIAGALYGAKRVINWGLTKYRASTLENKELADDKTWYKNFMYFVAQISREYPEFDDVWKNRGNLAQANPFALLQAEPLLKKISVEQKHNFIRIVEEYLKDIVDTQIAEMFPQEHEQDLREQGCQDPSIILAQASKYLVSEKQKRELREFLKQIDTLRLAFKLFLRRVRAPASDKNWQNSFNRFIFIVLPAPGFKEIWETYKTRALFYPPILLAAGDAFEKNIEDK